MSNPEKLYEGKAKIVYATSDPDVILQYYKDDATAFNALKKGTIKGKGVRNATMASLLYKFLESKGVRTHFIEQVDERTQKCRKVKIVPLEVIVRNRVAGSLQKRTGLAEGAVVSPPICEFYYKDDALGDPLLTKDHILLLGLADANLLRELREIAQQVNMHLKPLFEGVGLILVDFKIEFGYTSNKELLLADEISPDTCRFWDSKTLEKLDKDRFRQDLGNVEEAYEEVLKRVRKALGSESK